MQTFRVLHDRLAYATIWRCPQDKFTVYLLHQFLNEILCGTFVSAIRTENVFVSIFAAQHNAFNY